MGRHAPIGWCAAFAAALVAAPFGTLRAQAPQNPGMRADLIARLAVDQAIRDTLLREIYQRGLEPDTAFAARLNAVDAANTAWLKQIIATMGWPGRTLVGADGTHAAFVLLQHATGDPQFMASSVPLLEAAVARGDVRADEYALLFDRVAVEAGRPQRFGTQAQRVGGRMVFHRIDDSAHVDDRRAKMGLMPLMQYVRLMDSLYTAHPPKP